MSDKRPLFMVCYEIRAPGDEEMLVPLALVKGESQTAIAQEVARFTGLPLDAIALRSALEAPVEDVQRLTALLVAEWVLAQFAMMSQATGRVVRVAQ